MFNGHSLLSDTVILMRAHVGTQAPIYVSCLHILNTLLTDPVLREGTLRAIPADLPENGTSPFPSHPPTLTPALPTHLPCLPAVCSPSLFEPPAAREPGWGRVCHVPALRTPPRLTAFSRPFSASGFRPSASGLRAASLSFSGHRCAAVLSRSDSQVATRASAHLLLPGPSRLPELHGLSVRTQAPHPPPAPLDPSPLH